MQETDAMFQRHTTHPRGALGALELSEARFKRFMRELDAYERRLTFERTLDAFLDLYSSWKKRREPPLKLRLVMLAFELHRLNHQFQCDLSFQDAPTCERSSSGI
ncbi:MAG: hypothetical protein Q8R91_02645 [Candidatus Omnitrophota bacterium]|nr:hypothetical protein [Candidatus Omnitrophota bacterium]